METRAPYALVGFFVLAVVAAAFGFVYWLHNSGGLTERTVYRIQFENTVAGLLNGAAVLFNGIRVGEVTGLALSPANPNQVNATIAVAAGTPVRADTKVSLDFQGLTGVPVVILQGGTVQFDTASQQTPLLKADPLAGQSMTSAARDALRRVDIILSENAEPLRNTMANLNTFTGALARNSDKLDGIVAGLERMAGGGSANAARVAYDLTAPKIVPPITKPPEAQMTVAEPTALIVFEGRKIMVRPSEGEDPSFANAEWSDSIPKVLQARIIEAFENAGLARAIGRSTDGVTAHSNLVIEIRKFQFSRSTAPSGDIELAAKIILSDGKILDARVFQASVVAGGISASMAVAALDAAFSECATALIQWAAGTM